MVGRLCAMVSVIIPGYLIVVMAGWKRALEVLPAIIACGLSFAGMQFYVSNYMGPELTDILSSLTCIVVMVAVLKLWKPKNIMRLEGDRPVTLAHVEAHRPARSSLAWLPYLLLVVFVLAWGEPDDQGRRSIAGPTACCPCVRCREARPALNGLNVPGLHNLITRDAAGDAAAVALRGACSRSTG